jgi:hypothetical protein
MAGLKPRPFKTAAKAKQNKGKVVKLKHQARSTAKAKQQPMQSSSQGKATAKAKEQHKANNSQCKAEQRQSNS